MVLLIQFAQIPMEISVSSKVPKDAHQFGLKLPVQPRKAKCVLDQKDGAVMMDQHLSSRIVMEMESQTLSAVTRMEILECAKAPKDAVTAGQTTFAPINKSDTKNINKTVSYITPV